MAEKRGQYVYNDDGTVSTLVSISGADSNGGGLGVTTTDVLPMDMQARLINTVVTHTGQAVTPSNSSVQATWQPVPDGMSEFIQNLSADAGLATIYTHIQWSEDGTNASGKTSGTTSSSMAISLKTSPNWLAVGGAFYKAEVWNGDASPHTCSANIKFRA